MKQSISLAVSVFIGTLAARLLVSQGLAWRQASLQNEALSSASTALLVMVSDWVLHSVFQATIPHKSFARQTAFSFYNVISSAALARALAAGPVDQTA